MRGLAYIDDHYSIDALRRAFEAFVPQLSAEPAAATMANATEPPHAGALEDAEAKLDLSH